MKLGKLGVFYSFHEMTPPDIAAAARRIESLGFSAVWLPEFTGRHCFLLAGHILANTTTLIAATGIANIYHREPGVTVAAQRTLADFYNNRFLLGLGVSHHPMVEGVRGLKYGPPVATMRGYLDAMAAAPDQQGYGVDLDTPIVIAALGPKMLELARDKCQGAYPYFVSPEHTKTARRILGPGKLLCVEQKIILETNFETARAAAQQSTAIYGGLPNYRNNWKRLGFSDAEIDSCSERFLNAFFAWGDAAAIRKRVQEHFDAGADHVSVQPLHPTKYALHWEALEAVASAF
jgi:probable F420-dependent oxidoreductase